MRILVPVDESLHSRRVIEFISHRETLLGTTPEIELVNVQYSVPETIIHLFGMEAVKQYYLEAGKKVFDELGPEALRRRGVTERVLYGDIGKTLAEETILQAAYTFEQAHPEFTKTAPKGEIKE